MHQDVAFAPQYATRPTGTVSSSARHSTRLSTFSCRSATEYAGRASVALRTQPRGTAGRALGARFAEVQIRDVMSRDLVVLPARAQRVGAARPLACARHAVHPVMDLRGAPVGLVTSAS